MQFTSFVALLAGASTAYAHGVILSAEGDSGESQGFLVNKNVARNCTEISPCQQDSVIIRDAEIKQNIVNGCGRTEINGNIDIGEQTEVELAADRMTQVQAGSNVAVTIHQVNADGAGPYECDLDDTSNSGTFKKLQVSNNVPGTNGLSDAKFEQFTINVQMPDDLNCTGASTGDICTVRCRNNALAGPFGGCFAVQQTDNNGGRGQNDEGASNIQTKQSLDAISKQIQVNKADFKTAIEANQAAGAAGGGAGAAAAEALVNGTDGAGAAASAAAAADAASSTDSADSNNNNDNNNNNGGNNGNNGGNNNNNNNNNDDDNNGGNNNNNGGGNNGGFGGFGNGFGNGFGGNGFGGGFGRRVNHNANKVKRTLSKRFFS